MERTIKTLEEMRENAKRLFIENSIIVHTSTLEVKPDTKSYLEMIIELNQAISILENSTMAKSDVKTLKGNRLSTR